MFIFTGLLGVLYSENKVPAFAGLKMFQALGAAIAFSSSRVICMRTKLYFVGTVLLTSMIGYIVMEILLRHDRKKEKMIKDEELEKTIKVEEA